MRRRIEIAIAALAPCAVAGVALAATPGERVQVSVNAHGGRGVSPKEPAAAVTRSGRQLVVWVQDDNPDGSVVWGRVIGVDGAPVGGPFEIAGPNPNARDPAVAVRGRRDEFLVAWSESDFQTRRVMARRFDGEGDPLGEAFTLSEAALDPAVAYGGKRREFVVVWREFTPGGSRIYGARVPGGRSSRTEPAVVSRGGGSEVAESAPDVTYDSREGRWLVAWERNGTVLARILHANPGTPLGRQRRLAKRGSPRSAVPRITYNSHAREYLATWFAAGSRIRRLQADGHAYGQEIEVKGGASFETVGVGDIAAAPDGHYEILLNGDDDTQQPPGSAVLTRRLGVDLKLGRRLQRVSRSDRSISAAGHAIVYSRANDRFRAVWVEGRTPSNEPNEPASNLEVWTRVL